MNGSDDAQPLVLNRSGGRPPAEFRPVEDRPDDGLIDVWGIVSVLKRRKLIMLFTVTVCLVGLTAVIAQRKAQFTAKGVVSLDTPAPTNVVFDAANQTFRFDNATITRELELLRSGELALRTAESLGLATDPRFWKAIGKVEDAEKGGGASRFLSMLPDAVRSPVEQAVDFVRSLRPAKVEEVEDGEATAGTNREAAQELLKRSTVTAIGQGPVFEFAFKAEDPRVAARIVNRHLENYIEDRITQADSGRTRAVTWLEDRVERARQDLADAEAKLGRYRAETGLTKDRDSNVINTLILQTSTDLNAAQTELARKQAAVQQTERALGSGGVDAVLNAIQSGAVTIMREQLSRLHQRAGELQTTHGERHPDLQKVRSEIQAVQGAITREGRRYLNEMRTDLAVARQNVETIRQRLEQYKREFSELQNHDKGQNVLAQEVDAQRQVFMALMEKLKEVQHTTGASAEARIITRASTPARADFPSKSVLLAAAGIVSLTVGLLAAFLAELMERGYRRGTDLERQHGVTVVTTMPELKLRKRRNGQELSAGTSAPIMYFRETLRSIHVMLDINRRRNQGVSVLVTSSLPKEGKTFLTSSLAREIGASGRRVIVVDCDLRRPNLGETFSVQRTEGLVEVVAQGADYRGLIHIDPVSGVHVLSAGTGGEQAQRLLRSNRFVQLLDELKRQYDYVLLDSPPVLAAADAKMLACISDIVLMAVRWRSTRRIAVSQTVKELAELGCNNVAAIITRAEFRSITDSEPSGGVVYPLAA
ncbi:MAG TPA: AAA family ATPase [Azospirillaceae bacterium]|nr:AAA family ATPase [Azospirillaceae bacterium]